MKTLIIIMMAAGLSLAGDWPQFKRTANRQGCDLSEQMVLPSKLCCWLDFGSPIRASAAIMGGKAYAVSGRGLLARIDLSANAVDWHADLGGVNNESSPAVENGRVYVGSTAGSFYVLDAATGEILKEYKTNGPILASPLLYKGSVYFGSTDGLFHALDMDGNPKWTYRAFGRTGVGAINDAGGNILHGAAADSDLIVFPAGQALYWLRDMGTRADSVYIFRWPSSTTASGNTAISTPTIYAGQVYAGFTGQEELGSLFRFLLSGSDKFSIKTTTARSSLSVDTASGKLFFGSSYEGMWTIGGLQNWNTTRYWGSDPAGTAPICTNFTYGVNSSPAVINNCVIIGDEAGKLFFYQKDSLRSYYDGYASGPWANPRWRYCLASGKAIEASAAVCGGRTVVGSLDGCLYGFWDGTEVTSAVKVDGNNTGVTRRALSMPGTWTLSAYPNPVFGSAIVIAAQGFNLKGVLDIHDVSGRLINRIPLDGRAQTVTWNLKDLSGRAVAGGHYTGNIRDVTGLVKRTFGIQVVK